MDKLDTRFKPAPVVALDVSQVVMKYENGGNTHAKSWIAVIDGQTFEVTYKTDVEVQNSHRRKRNRRIVVTQTGYLRKIS